MNPLYPKLKRLLAIATLLVASLRAAPANRVVLDIPPTPEHPRNSEGGFATLPSGEILFVFSQFYGGGGDSNGARLVEVRSSDGGRSWGQSRLLVDNQGYLNVMSVSLLRLASGRLAMFYLVKKSCVDCHPYLTVSTDEGRTWSSPRLVFDAPGYFVLNNDRVIQTGHGRLILPVSFHRARHPVAEETSLDDRAIDLWYLSDDDGATWREADSWWALPEPSGSGLQEPGVVELADRSLFSWARTDVGEQFGFRSVDGGKTWSAPEPTELRSPCSPASIKRLPNSSALLAIYNDRPKGSGLPAADALAARWRLVAAVSNDGGRTWPSWKLLEDKPNFEFSYAAIHFVDDAVLLAYRVGGTPDKNYEQDRVSLRIRRIDLSWLPGAGSQ